MVNLHIISAFFKAYCVKSDFPITFIHIIFLRSFKQDDAVDAFGQKLRVYLQCVDLLSMNGKQLDHEPRVINFDHKCEENKIKYYNSYPNTVGSYERIFITTEDRSRFHDVNNKTKSEIQKSILNILKVCITLYFSNILYKLLLFILIHVDW